MNPEAIVGSACITVILLIGVPIVIMFVQKRPVKNVNWEAEARKALKADEELRKYFAKQFVKIEGICPATWPYIKEAFERLLAKGK